MIDEATRLIGRTVRGIDWIPTVEPFTRLVNGVYALGTLTEAGIVRPMRPDKLAKVGLALARWGPTPAAGYTSSAIRFPDREALDDEFGALTFGELHERTNALAHGLDEAGVREGHGVGILCRNHRGFIEATVACSKLGAHALYLNTSFAGPQVTEVAEREKPDALIYDQEFRELCAEAAKGRECFLAWHDSDEPDCSSLDELIASGDRSDLSPPAERGRVVILTSGTTGTPKGASRSQPESLSPAAALFSKIPLRARETTMIAAPLFHSWGFAHFTLGLALSSKLVLRRRFDPEETLAAIASTRATALVVVPVMLQRILDLGEKTIRMYDSSSLRVIAASGSTLPGELAIRVMDTFGDVLYNLYGSTEVAWATIATPAELRAAPGTAGTPPRGTIVKLFDEHDREVGPGERGRIFVANEMLFEGYTGGGNKAVIDGLMSTGDVGRFDEAGRLFVEGRDDEMIVSGGENVFPREIEDLLVKHQDIDDAALIGVDDEQFGQRLRAFIVKCQGASLSEDDVKQHVKANLARYKVPRDVIFVESLPRNATGKVVKRELAELETGDDGGGERGGSAQSADSDSDGSGAKAEKQRS
jgi:fatty-acyl-CoA synthase